MTKKDYIKLAKVLKDSISEEGDGLELDRLVIRIADMFKEDNPRFDYDRFHDAVYGKSE